MIRAHLNTNKKKMCSQIDIEVTAFISIILCPLSRYMVEIYQSGISDIFSPLLSVNTFELKGVAVNLLCQHRALEHEDKK